MGKRTWLSWMFFTAFAVALAHSSIPHAHPALNKKTASTTADHNTHSHDGHDHDSENHDQQSSLPVFSHFSNADFISAHTFNVQEKAWFIIAYLTPTGVLIKKPAELKKQISFPRARDLPSSRYRSAQLLRAPPLFS